MKPALLITAFLIGAIVPLLGILLAAFVAGCWYASSRNTPHIRKCEPELLAEIEEWTKAELQRSQQKRLR